MTQMSPVSTQRPTAHFGYFNHGNTGVSHDANYLRNSIDSIDESDEITSLYLERKFKFLEALVGAVLIALDDDWDGYGAERVIPEAIKTARQLGEALHVLPSDVPPPEIAVEPDGEIAFNWQSAADQMFSVSVGTRGRLSYAGLFGGEDVYGSTFFVDVLPTNILLAIKKVYAVG